MLLYISTKLVLLFILCILYMLKNLQAKITTLDRFKRSWLATAADIWNGLPADLILQGETCGWRTILKDEQRCICT